MDKSTHDIRDKAYYYWLRKIRRTIYDQSVASGTPVG